MRRFPITPLCLLLSVLALPTAAEPPHPSNLRSDILYTTKGEFVQVSPMRPLTLNAHVEQFQYDPLGLEIAYVGSETSGDTTTHFVKTVDVRTGHELSHLTLIGALGDQSTGFGLLGWSAGGKYLLLQRFTPDPSAANTAITEYLRWDLSTSPPTLRVIAPESHLPQDEQPIEESGDGVASPDRHWIVFQQHFQKRDADGKIGRQETAFLLYDPELNTFQTLTLPPGVVGTNIWSDATHLILLGNTRQQFDVVTGQVSPRPASPITDALAASHKYPDLTLDTEFRELDDLHSEGYLNSSILWIRRIPATKQPLGVAAAGIIPINRRPDEFGGDDTQAVWSPTGMQVAFIANNDLCVTDLKSATDLLPNERLAVGLKLTCPEERALADSDLKQIGLALIQYAQDEDEHYPPATDFEKTIYPYLKTHDVFSVGGHKFVYEPPSDLALAKMEDPANTEMAFIDLPCARIVLMGDGHVKPQMKAANGEQE